MKLGFDLDKIFIDTPPIIPDMIIEKLYRKTYSRTLSYRIPSSTEQIIRRYSHIPFFRPPIMNNISFAKSLKKKKYPLFLLSSRFSFLHDKTAAIVKKYKLDSIFTKMYFNDKNEQPHIFKNKILQKIDIQRYIDDDLLLLQFVAKNHPDKKFYWYNKKINKRIGKNLSAIMNLSEILL